MERARAIRGGVAAALAFGIACTAPVGGGPSVPDEDRGDLEQAVATILDASGGVAELLEHPELMFGGGTYEAKWDPGPVRGDISVLCYPTYLPAVLAARLKVLDAGRTAFPVVLRELDELDPGSISDPCRIAFADCLLSELIRGGFARSGKENPFSAEGAGQILREWTTLWGRVADDDELWSLRTSPELARYRARLIERTAGSDDFFVPDPVLAPGARLTVETPRGSLTIEADVGFGRTYSLDGLRTFVPLAFPSLRRTDLWKTELFGSGASTSNPEEPGFYRCGEGTVRFDSLAAARDWLQSEAPLASDADTRARLYAEAPLVLSPDGLAVSWSTLEDGGSLSVAIHRIEIAGHSTAELPGARAGAVTLELPPR